MFEKCHVTHGHSPTPLPFTHVAQVPQDLRTDAHPCKNNINQNWDPSWWWGKRKWTASTSVGLHHVEVLQVELLPHPRVISEIIHGKAHHLQAWTGRGETPCSAWGWQHIPRFNLSLLCFCSWLKWHVWLLGMMTQERLRVADILGRHHVCLNSLEGSVSAHTLTAVLLLDFSDDAMVKRRLTKSILQEIWERGGGWDEDNLVDRNVQGYRWKTHLPQSVSPGSHILRI